MQNKQITSCVVVKKELEQNHAFLCAYFTAKEDINISLIRSSLQKNLPKYMVPQYFVQLEKLPYTPNGKIDRKKLPLPNMEVRNKNIVLPRNEMDENLINILKDILNIEDISIEDSFFELGGDSLSAINLCTKIYSDLNIEIFVKDVLEKPIIKDLSDYISSKNMSASGTVISKVNRSQSYVVSSAQKRIYFASIVSGEDSVLYNICGGLILDSIPNIKKLEKAFNTLIKRQSSLRTYFEMEDNQLVQKIESKIDFKLNVYSNLIYLLHH